jgi:hypothetical protein
MNTPEICLVLNKKAVNEPAVQEAVEGVRRKADLSVRIPWDARGNRSSTGSGSTTG